MATPAPDNFTQKLNKIRQSDCSPKLKILQVQALIQQIKFKLSAYHANPSEHKKSIEDTMSTAFTNEMSEPIDHQTLQQLQNKIILKRDIKFELNEQLEEVEEQLESIEQSVSIKQGIDDQIRKNIDKKRMQIQLQAFQKKAYKAPQKQPKNKTFSIFTNRVKSIFT